MLKLYDYLASGNGYKIRLLLTQLHIPFKRIQVDILAKETRTPEFLAKNPNGRIPVLELESGEYLAESNAILFYLAEGTRFFPTDPLERAQVMQWMFFEQYSHEPNIATVRFWIHYLDKKVEWAEKISEKRKQGYAALGVMEGHVKHRDFFVGNHYSIADIALYAYTHVAEEGEFSLAEYPAVRAWMNRVAAQPDHLPITQDC